MKPKLYGLIGYPLTHSFSQTYFQVKFEKEYIKNASYENFPLPDIEQLPHLLKEHPQLSGFNVTIPHKRSIIPYLSELDPVANKVGAVNTVKIIGKKLRGFNTDVIGFEKAIKPLLHADCKKALIFGRGGATLAVKHVLEMLGINFQVVSRKPNEGELAYEALSGELIENHTCLINCTPVGMASFKDAELPIPYEGIGEYHLVFDLIYNPEKTPLLEKAEARGAKISNGYNMLKFQAEASWEIWNHKTI
jgi:shikimate dehydrogenase